MRGPGKGKSNNPAGKPKGTLNRTTKESKEFLKSILFAEFDNIEDSLRRAREESDSKYIDLLSKLLQFVLPRQVEADAKGEIKIKVVYGKRSGPDCGPS